MSNADVYAKVTRDIIAALEAGTVPWVKPWQGSGLPHNATTGRAYSGINILATWVTTMSKGYTGAGWVTFKQALSANCCVRKGERATSVMFMSKIEKRRATEDESASSFFLARAYSVFNVDQLTELKPGALDALRARHAGTVFHHDAVETCERLVAASGAVIHSDVLACYRPLLDTIGMPPRNSFVTVGRYYATLFHELTHWTGHESRLSRGLDGRFGSGSYAAEELVAELGAAFLAHTFGFDVVSQSAAYLQSWLRGLTDHPAMLVQAASAASRAANLLLGKVAAEEADDDSTTAAIAA